MVLQTALHQLVADGKVLYLGISDTPAWVVVKCNECESATLKVAMKPAILTDMSQTPATTA
jgi:aryl-alcohol dehydrogenase-like predicted oxidoreductase